MGKNLVFIPFRKSISASCFAHVYLIHVLSCHLVLNAHPLCNLQGRAGELRVPLFYKARVHVTLRMGLIRSCLYGIRTLFSSVVGLIHSWCSIPSSQHAPPLLKSRL